MNEKNQELLASLKLKRSREFFNDLCEVCTKHRIQISSTGYDGLMFWPLREGEVVLEGGVDEYESLKELGETWE